MPISRAGSKFRARGLTLIELIVALTIVSLVVALAVPAFAAGIEHARYAAAARTLVTGLKQTRRLAVAEQREVRFTLDIASRAVSIDSSPLSLNAPADADLAMTTAESERSSGTRGTIRFFPDGSSTGGTIELLDGDRSHVVSVDWLTGRVALSR